MRRHRKTCTPRTAGRLSGPAPPWYDGSMKIFLLTDMEGVCGVLDCQEWCVPGGRYYEAGRELATAEVNAAVEGFHAAGATEVVVVDGHGHGGIVHRLLDRRTLYSRGWVGPYPFGMDRSYDALAFVGQHAKSGSIRAHIAHTGSFEVLDLRINGTSVGEFGIWAMVAATFGIPTIFGSGDQAFAEEAASLVPGIFTVAVKKGVNPSPCDDLPEEAYATCNLGALHLHPQEARERIRAGAAKALTLLRTDPDRFPIPPPEPPFRLDLRYRKSAGREARAVRQFHPSDLVAALNSPELPVDAP